MPLPGQVTVRDEFKAQPKSKEKKPLYTRLERRRNALPPSNANENVPNSPDWLEVNHPLTPITSQNKGYREDIRLRNRQVDELGESANAAVGSAVEYKERAAAARALAQLQAMQERSQEIFGAVGNLNYNFGIGQVGEGKRADVIASAKRLLGTPYSWGGGHRSKPGPSYGTQHGSNIYGVDCSGLVRYAFAKAGIKRWGRQATSQVQSTYGRVAPISSLLPGDLVVRGPQGKSTHVAIYLGNGKIIEAQKTGTRVHIRSIGNGSGWTGIHLSY